MQFIDLHCDTLMKAYLQKKSTIYEMPGCMLDVKRMKAANQLAQFFAIFMLPPNAADILKLTSIVEDDEYIETSMKIFNETINSYKEMIAVAHNASDILDNQKKGMMSALLTFEDGRPIQGKFENFDKYYNQGIRLITLTWNHENCFGYPNSKNPELMNKGLKDFGKEAISYMNDLGIIIDVSHLSDGGFYDVATRSKKPFIASHSNARSLSPHPRNLTDDMIKVLGEKGGITGINFGAEFLSFDITSKDSKIEDMVTHIKKIANLGGIDCVALGSDLDGVDGNLEIDSIDKVPHLFDALKKEGFHESEIEKIAYQNALRVIQEVL